jgi:hypothetical protein
MTTYISFRSYADPLRISAQYATPVARLLVHSAPADITPEERVRLAAANALADEIGDVLYDRDRVSNARVRQPLSTFIAHMGAFHDVLLATATVSPTDSARAARAKELLDTFFPDGVSFTKLEAPAAWYEGERRMQQIEKRGLTEEIIGLTGPDFLPAARKATKDLGEAIGVGSVPRDQPAGRALQQKLARFSRKVGSYVRLLAAAVDEENEDSVLRFLKAVEPIDEYRRSGRTLSTEEESQDSNTEEPPANDGTPSTPVTPASPTSPTEPGTEADPSVAPGGPFGPA